MNKNPAVELFGTVGRAHCTGGHKSDLKILKSPFYHPDSVVYSFCEGCGNYLELTRKRAEELANEAGANLPDDLTGLYIQTASCNLCDGTEKRVKFRKIP